MNYMYFCLSVTVLLVLNSPLASSQRVCGTLPPVWRNNNITCPHRAVCADVFTTSRDWYNGTRCQETRVLSNCICDGNQVCPFNNPNHQLYASATHRQFICESTCNIPWCGNVPSMDPLRPSSGRRNRNRGRPDANAPVVAFTAEQRDRNFGGKTYYKIACRCPRHHFPVSRRGGRSRAVKAYRYQYNYTLRRYVTQYVCNTSHRDEPREDPCSE